jgi:hypothetical protein
VLIPLVLGRKCKTTGFIDVKEVTGFQVQRTEGVLRH